MAMTPFASSIAPLWEQMPLQSIRASDTEKRAPEAEMASFSDIFKEAVDAVKETDAEKTELEYMMATGQLDNPSLLTIASSKALLSVQLLVQLRDKSLEAYNELTRMNL